MLACVVGLVAALAASELISEHSRRAALSSFTSRAEGSVSDVEEAFRRYTTLAHSIHGLFAAGPVDRRGWDAFIASQELESNFGAIEAFVIPGLSEGYPPPEAVDAAAHPELFDPGLPGDPILIPDQSTAGPGVAHDWLVIPLSHERDAGAGSEPGSESARPSAVYVRISIDRLIDLSLIADAREFDVQVYDVQHPERRNLVFDMEDPTPQHGGASTEPLRERFPCRLGGRRLEFVVVGHVVRDRLAGGVMVLGAVCSLLFSGLVALAARTGARALDLADRMIDGRLAIERRYREIVDNCADGIFCAGPDGLLTAVNPAMTHLLGYAHPREVIAARLHFEACFLDAVDLGAAAMRDPDLGGVELRLASRGETEVWVHLRIREVPGVGDVRLTYEGLCTDVTKLRQARVEAGLRTRAEAEQERLHAAIVEMERVLGIVGHELRTPLASIRAMAEILLSPGMTHLVDHDKYLHQILNQSVHLVGIVSNILDAARYNSGKADWRWDTVALHDVCQDALDTVRPLLSPDVELTAAVPKNLKFAGDPAAVRRLLVNLLANACKFTTSGSIHLAAQVQGDEVMIRVADTGAGIDRERLPDLGKPFVLSSGAVDGRHVEGSGLGISLCLAVAAAHGGALTIDTEPGRGTTVRVSLRTDLAAPLPVSFHPLRKSA